MEPDGVALATIAGFTGHEVRQIEIEAAFRLVEAGRAQVAGETGRTRGKLVLDAALAGTGARVRHQEMTSMQLVHRRQGCGGGAPPDRRRLRAGGEFVAMSLALLAIGAAAGVPVPLYVAYQRQFEIGPSGLTGAFAIYIVPLAVMLLVCGRLSDHLGRRPVAAVALLLDALACVIFTQVDATAVLLVARSVQGLATGLGVAALAAFVVDLQPANRPGLGGSVASAAAPGGLAIGALASGVLVAYGPLPLTLVYLVFAGFLVVAALAVVMIRETATKTPGALRSLQPSFAVPAGTRALFAAACACFIASWALGGYYQALGPSVAADILGVTNPLAGGLVLASLTGASGVAGLLAVRLQAQHALIGGLTALVAGLVGVVVALNLQATVGFFIASGLAGVGFGTSFSGAMRLILTGRSTAERAGVLSAAYLVSYLGSAAPSFLAGLVIPTWGLMTVTTVYAALVVVLALISGAAAIALRSPTTAREA